VAAGLAGALAAADLVDEYRLLVQPLVWAADRPCSTSSSVTVAPWLRMMYALTSSPRLGCGTLLDPRHLGLVDATQLPSGVVVHVYRPRTPESEDP
jgi:hypothetical protein